METKQKQITNKQTLIFTHIKGKQNYPAISKKTLFQAVKKVNV